jgi:hypothetical protein
MIIISYLLLEFLPDAELLTQIIAFLPCFALQVEKKHFSMKKEPKSYIKPVH